MLTEAVLSTLRLPTFVYALMRNSNPDNSNKHVTKKHERVIDTAGSSDATGLLNNDANRNRADNRVGEQMTEGRGGGLVSSPSSASIEQPLDTQLDNSLSPGLSTNLSTSSIAQAGLLGRESHAAVRAGSNYRKSNGNTALQQCVVEELDKYFAMLEGHPPSDLYKLVTTQVETALFSYVLEACGNNQSRAAEYLGVSRGTLRNRIVDLSLDQ